MTNTMRKALRDSMGLLWLANQDTTTRIYGTLVSFDALWLEIIRDRITN